MLVVSFLIVDVGSRVCYVSCDFLLSIVFVFFFLMLRRPPRSTPLYSSAASDVYKGEVSVSVSVLSVSVSVSV